MATPKEQAQAEVYRVESEVRAAEGQVSLRRQQLASERDEGRKAFARGNLQTAEVSVTNAKRALDLARQQLRRVS
jgi:hypothetical protein